MNSLLINLLPFQSPSKVGGPSQGAESEEHLLRLAHNVFNFAAGPCSRFRVILSSARDPVCEKLSVAICDLKIVVPTAGCKVQEMNPNSMALCHSDETGRFVIGRILVL